jgi:hypothetical protein
MTHSRLEDDRTCVNAILLEWLIPLICSILLLVCVCFAVYEFTKQTRLVFWGVRTDATCFHKQRNVRTESRLFRFTTEDGANIVVRDIFGTWTAKVDDVIPIVYLPTDPEVVSQSGIEGWFFLIYTIGIGFLVGVFFRYYLHWRYSE